MALPAEVMKNVPTIEEFWAAFTKSQEEAAERWKEWERAHRETERVVKRVGRQMGDLHNRFGELAEHLVAPGIIRRFNELGYQFDDTIAERVKITDGSGGILTEIDLLLENGNYSIAVEVKTRPREKDVEHHVRRLELLREHKDKRNDRRKIQGAIAGAVFLKETMDAAIEAGLYVIEQSGDTMKLNIPKGFTPREW
ncbi:MAG: hypothetical protein LBH57_00175 [Treponema sp.]|jgi:hypothetical protein|nr:hypothetical protein [Treponema sp.]